MHDVYLKNADIPVKTNARVFSLTKECIATIAYHTIPARSFRYGEDKKPILVVDDDPDVRTALQMFLENHGYASETAENGWDGLTKLERTDYDAVILDYTMPGITGLAVLQQMQQRHLSIPVVMITGYISTQETAQVLTAGARACLFKPFDCEDLKEFLECSVCTVP